MNWETIIKELEGNSHLLGEARTIRLHKTLSNKDFIEWLPKIRKEREEGRIRITLKQIKFLVEYCEVYELDFWIVEKPLAIYIFEGDKL